jgi:hypothetical protein
MADAPMPKLAQEETPAPSRKTRLKWWGGIYFLGVFCNPSAILAFFLFPFGLGDDYGLAFCWVWKNFFAEPIRDVSFAFFVSLALAYGTYLLHLLLTWRAKNRRIFLYLMLSLVLIVSANVVGCHNMEVDHQNNPFQ